MADRAEEAEDGEEESNDVQGANAIHSSLNLRAEVDVVFEMRLLADEGAIEEEADDLRAGARRRRCRAVAH